MPIYKNNTNKDIIINNDRVVPNATWESNTWVDIVGLDVVDEHPMYNPIYYSERIVNDKIIVIPDHFKRFAVHYAVENGCPRIYYSSKKNTPATLLYPGARWNARFYEKIIKNIIIEWVGYPGVLWLQIEKI